MQSGKYMYVSGGNPNSPNIYSTNYGSSTSNNASSFAGQVRYNVSNQYLEVFDGNILSDIMHQITGKSYNFQSGIDRDSVRAFIANSEYALAY